VTSDRTDERIWVTGTDTCGNPYSYNWNDYTQSGFNNAWWQFPCYANHGTIHSTESSTGSGTTVSF
jgi:hypothetical protein